MAHVSRDDAPPWQQQRNDSRACGSNAITHAHWTLLLVLLAQDLTPDTLSPSFHHASCGCVADVSLRPSNPHTPHPVYTAPQNVLKAWSELGAQDPEKLKALLVERRLKTFQGLLLQTVLDFVACGGESPGGSKPLVLSCCCVLAGAPFLYISSTHSPQVSRRGCSQGWQHLHRAGSRQQQQYRQTAAARSMHAFRP